MSGTIPWRLSEAVHEAVALQRVWLAQSRAAMEPGQPEPCGASDAYVTWALAHIAPKRAAAAQARSQRSVAERLAERRAAVAS